MNYYEKENCELHELERKYKMKAETKMVLIGLALVLTTLCIMYGGAIWTALHNL